MKKKERVERVIFDNKRGYKGNDRTKIRLIEPGIEFILNILWDRYTLETDDISIVCLPADVLCGIAEARLGKTVKIEGVSMGAYNDGYVKLSPSILEVGRYRGMSETVANTWPYQFNFGALFLDTFSVIENSEPRKRTARDIELGIAEKTIIDMVSKNPSLLLNFTPRVFEVFVGSLLANLGFSKIKLSRFSKDCGIDVYAICFEGDIENLVVIEVKHYLKNKVGLAIVDRLNEVRDAVGASKGIVFTTSSFSLDARHRYNAHSSKISLIDHEKLLDLLETASGHWHVTPSGLWTLPRRTKETYDDLNKNSKNEQ